METIEPIYSFGQILKGFAYERGGVYEAWRRDDATDPSRRIHTYVGKFNSLEEAKKAVLPKPQTYKNEFNKPCSECHGSGRRHDDEDECAICSGTGEVSIDQL